MDGIGLHFKSVSEETNQDGKKLYTKSLYLLNNFGWGGIYNRLTTFFPKKTF